ncbi:MAG: DUF4199 domain-containing protein [Cyclobacteriaceae bacterium]|nr:DUF4199 domain-containing protein [Cyclobacteriaceae bacterium]
MPDNPVKFRKWNPIFSVPLRYGFLAGIISMLLFLILHYSGKNPFLIPPLFDFRIILYPIVLVFAIRDFKENKNGGILHFWQGISVGVQTVLTGALLMAIFILFFGGLIETAMVPDYILEMTEQIKSMNEDVMNSVGSDAISRSLELLPTTDIYDLALDYFIKSLPYGVFLTIIISLILRNKNLNLWKTN